MPPIVLGGQLQQQLESAVLALGSLDGVSALLPDKALFLYTCIRKEAVLSSQIEGTADRPLIRPRSPMRRTS